MNKSTENTPQCTWRYKKQRCPVQFHPWVVYTGDNSAQRENSQRYKCKSPIVATQHPIKDTWRTKINPTNFQTEQSLDSHHSLRVHPLKWELLVQRSLHTPVETFMGYWQCINYSQYQQSKSYQIMLLILSLLWLVHTTRETEWHISAWCIHFKVKITKIYRTSLCTYKSKSTSYTFFL